MQLWICLLPRPRIDALCKFAAGDLRADRGDALAAMLVGLETYQQFGGPVSWLVMQTNQFRLGRVDLPRPQVCREPVCEGCATSVVLSLTYV